MAMIVVLGIGVTLSGDMLGIQKCPEKSSCNKSGSEGRGFVCFCERNKRFICRQNAKEIDS